MKKIVLLSCLFLATLTINAQNWLTDFNQAKEIAQKEKKIIIMSFQGSDWCAPCIKLDKNFFRTEEFKTYADKHFVMLKVDFPRKKKNRLTKPQKKHNNNLAEKYNQQGHFPLVVVVNYKGTIISKTGYNAISVSEFISKLDQN